MNTGNFYLINEELLLGKGVRNGMVYIIDKRKAYHVKKELIDILLSLEKEKVPRVFSRYVHKNCTVKSIEQLETQLPQIKNILLDVTNKCNLKCRNCYHSNRNDDRGVEDTVDWVSKVSRKKSMALSLLGGEPLSLGAEKIFDLLKVKSSDFSKIKIFTNGTLLNEEYFEIFKGIPVRLHVSIYGLSPKTHDSYTGLRKSFRRTLKNIIACKKLELPVHVSAILNYEDYLRYSHGKSFLSNLGVPIYADLVRPLVPEDSLLFSQRLNILKTKHKPIKNHSLQEIKLNAISHSCVRDKISITTDGKILACPWDRNQPLGSVRDIAPDELDSLKKPSWRFLPLQKKYSECSKCEFSILCFDCIYMNNSLFDENKTKPTLCQYSPSKGAYYGRRFDLF